MKPSITSRRKRPLLYRALAVLFWLLVWEAASVLVGQEILLTSPVTALLALLRLMGTGAFYGSVAGSFGRILLGFALAAILGAALAALAAAFDPVAALLRPLMSTVKATPVASFVILALVWIRARNLSVFTAFLMVLPVIYQGVLSGLGSADTKLLEMARVFNVGKWNTARAIYVPAAFPYFLSAAQTSLGICWKAGIAAEVIGQPAGSIGENLYRAKLFLATDELFAWTIAIILLSVLFEKTVVVLINKLGSVYERRALK